MEKSLHLTTHSKLNMLIDTHGRTIDYLRVAITDKCNLRCFYCMPEEGITFLKRSDLMSYEELIRVIKIVAKVGVRKIRITGGEPFLRKDCMHLIREISKISEIEKIALTTNGTLTHLYIDELIALGVKSINLSLDSIDKTRFSEITKRDWFDQVWSFYENIIERPELDVKLNAVVMGGRNIEDLIPMVELTKKQNVSVRFIEEMPFNGSGRSEAKLEWDYKKILGHLTDHFEDIEKIEDGPNSTSVNYTVKGFVGSFGIIPAYSRSFCGTCNRLRLTPQGKIKACLYDDGVFNLRDFMRAGATDESILMAIKEAVGHKAKDGFEAVKNRNNPFVNESMATIGG